MVIIESQSFNAGHNMDVQWQGVITSMGHTASILPQTTLDNNAFFATTDVLIVSSGVIAISAARRNIIQQFEQSGKPVYIQSEYDCNYTSNQAFTQVVTNGGGTFNWVATVAGDLIPMNVLGTFATTNAAVAPLGYYWYSCNGAAGCNVFPFLSYGGTNHGFYFCPPNPGFGVVITTTDQDWVRVGTSLPLMQNIITHLITPSLCSSNNAFNVNLGPDTTLCSGSLTLNATTPGATYLWSTGSTAATLNVSTTGTYFVAVNVGGCIARDTINVTFSGSMTVNLGNDTTICQGSSVTLNATTAGATYLWSNGATTPTISVSTPGNYSVTVSIGACNGTDNINITVQALPIVNLGNDTSICQGSSVNLNATNAGATYLWNTGATSATISPSTAGNYSVVATIGACTASDNMNLTILPNPSPNLGNDTTICQGSSVTLNATTAGATYLWNTGATTPTISASTTGNYSVTVTLAGCTGTDNINITVQALPVANLGNDTSICQGNSVNLNAINAGATYLWNTGATSATISPSTAGNYSVIVTMGSCTATDNMNLTILPNPSPNLGNDTSICQGNSLTIDATTLGATYLWNTGETTASISVNATGNYSVVVSVGICSGTDNINVNVLPSPVLNLGNDTAICQGETLLLDAGNSGASYLWSTGASTQQISAQTTGNYSVTVTVGTCSVTDDINLTINALPIVNLGNDTSICFGSTLLLNAANAGSTFLWSTNENTQTISVNSSGTYFVEVTDVSNCFATDTIDVTILNPILVDLGNDTSICAGQTITLNAGNAGATYLWNTGSVNQTLIVSTNGQYSVEVNSNGCIGQDTFNLAINPLPIINLGNDTVLCLNSSLTLDATLPGATYLWSNAQITPTINVTSSGNYSVQVFVNGCSGSDAIQVTFIAPPVVNLGADTAVCIGTILQLNAGNNGSTFLWNDATTSQTLTVNNSGTYFVAVDNGVCINSDSIQITYNSPVAVNLGNDTTFCAGATPIINLNAGNPGAIYTWSNGANVQSIDVLGAGTYSVSVLIGGCVSGDTIIISSSPDIDLPNRLSLCGVNSVTLDVGQHLGSSYVWSTGSTSSSITVSEPGIYSVTMTNGNCVETEQTELVGSISGDLIFIPNAFSPNGDGKNELFEVVASDVLQFHLYIFNRWGELVYETENINDTWNGTHKGKMCENGVYIWRVNYATFCNGNILEYKTGSVSLLR